MISASVVGFVVIGIVVLRPGQVRSRSLEPGRVGSPRSRLAFPLVVPPNPLWGAAIVLGWWLHPLVAVAVVVGPTVQRVRRRRLDRTRTDRAVTRALPETVDLILLGVGAGLSARRALGRCETWLPEPFRAAFAEARRRSNAGESFAEALESATEPLGESALPLVSVLVAAEHTAGSLVPTLVRVGDEARRRRRVEAQERARRLPVTMLVPLVLCVLPAFGLLAVAPLLISSLRDLGIGGVGGPGP
jgi:tight adherence protein C